METNLDHLFQAYFAGVMSETEMVGFEKRLASDPAFKDQFDEYKIGMIAGSRLEYLDAKNKVAKIISLKPKIKNLKFYYRIAASVLILITTSWLIIQYTQAPNIDKLMATYYVPPPYSGSRVGGQITNDIESAQVKFSQKDWTAVLDIIENLPDTDQQKTLAKKLKAHSLLGLHKNDEAIGIFRDIYSTSSSSEKYDDLWYLSLAFLSKGEIDSTKFYLEKITSGAGNHLRKERVMELGLDLR